MIELLTLVTITGVLITLLALFNLLELLIRAVNPVCVYLLRHTGNLFSVSKIKEFNFFIKEKERKFFI